MTRKVVHEIKLSKSVTVALYLIGSALTLNLATPLISVSPASAELGYGDRVEVEIINWPASTYVEGSVTVSGELSTCELCR